MSHPAVNLWNQCESWSSYPEINQKANDNIWTFNMLPPSVLQTDWMFSVVMDERSVQTGDEFQFCLLVQLKIVNPWWCHKHLPTHSEG